MKLYHLGILAVRTISLYCLLKVLDLLSQLGFVLHRTGEIDGFLSDMFYPVVILLSLWSAAAAIFWFSAPPLAKAMFGSDTENSVGLQAAISIEQAYALAFCIVGILAVLSAIPLVVQGLQLHFFWDSNLVDAQISLQKQAHYMSALLSMLAGLLLIFGRNVIVRVLVGSHGEA